MTFKTANYRNCKPCDGNHGETQCFFSSDKIFLNPFSILSGPWCRGTKGAESFMKIFITVSFRIGHSTLRRNCWIVKDVNFVREDHFFNEMRQVVGFDIRLIQILTRILCLQQSSIM